MFLHWCKKMKYTDSDLYKLYGCKSPVYGDPFYLTIEERNTLYESNGVCYVPMASVASVACPRSKPPWIPIKNMQVSL